MYFKSVKLVNFKSFSDDAQNEILIEKRVTSIIGQNESGKTNIIEALSHISFTNVDSELFKNDYINRQDSSKNISLEIILKPTDDEINSLKIKNDAKVIITKTEIIYMGSIVPYFKEKFNKTISTLLGILENSNLGMSSEPLKRFNKKLIFLQSEEEVNITQIQSIIKTLENQYNNYNFSLKTELTEPLKNFSLSLKDYFLIFPKVFLRQTNKTLNSSYPLEQIKKELNDTNAFSYSLLNSFLKLINIQPDNFLQAFDANNSGIRASTRDKIQRNMQKYINEPFQKFYTTEKINLSIEFNMDSIDFFVKSGEGMGLLLKERSNGLRWYIDTFIDARANDIPYNNTLYLFDEPGISLHINAQKELLKLFNQLANNSNQIVYTTHSPFLLNTSIDGLQMIRAVVKGNDGNSKIYKTAYDSRINPISQQDTLSPIIHAIGMSLNDTFGPSKDKFNIICEGVSDYIYLKTFFDIIDSKKFEYYIIPSTGVTTSINIVNILYGWQCPFIVLFDYDKEGVESGANVLRNTELYEYGKQFIYLNSPTETELKDKSYKTNPYMIEDLVGRENLKKFMIKNQLPIDCDTKSKTVLAKLYCEDIKANTDRVDSNTLSNFKNLYNRITEIINIKL